MSDFVHKYLCYFILGAVIVLVVVGAIICNTDLCLWEKYGSAVAGMSSLVSIYFLYVTLNRQDRSFKQERFEITFYNLLEQRKKAINSLVFKQNALDELKFDSVVYHGEDCFIPIFQDVQRIKNSLCCDEYLGVLPDSELPEALEDVVCQPSLENVFEAQLKCSCKRLNYFYKITKEEFDAAKSLKTEDEIYRRCFQLLLGRNTLSAEYYFRFQSLILTFLAESRGLSSDARYLQVFASQMEKPELSLLHYESLVNSDFEQLMIKSKMSELVRKCLNDFKYNYKRT